MKVKDFIMKLDGSDLEILNKLSECKSPDQAYEVAKSYGVDEPQEVFVAEMTKLYDAVKELEDSELENVAGGLNSNDIIASAVLSVIGTLGVAGTISVVGTGFMASAAA